MIGGVKGKEELPWYVYKKDISNNEIYVCQGVDNELLMNNGLYAVSYTHLTLPTTPYV